eukprot:3597989-Karenia_brevis.AAC.1
MPMVAGMPMGMGTKGCEKCCALLFSSLESHPAHFSKQVLRQRLVSVSVDGQMTKGGPEHRHNSSGAAEALWAELHGNIGCLTPTNWDRFHRADIAFWRACKATPAVIAVFDMSKQIEYLFGMGDGVALFRAIGEMQGAQKGRAVPQRVAAPGGTRKVAYITQVPSNMLHNYEFIVQGLWARVAWLQAGHNGHSIAHLLEISRRITDFDFVFFLLLFDDILKVCIRPFAMVTQDVLEPASVMHSQGTALSRMRQARHALARIRRIFRVAVLLRQHAPQPDVANFLAAYRETADGLFFPMFFSEALDLLTRVP